MATRAQPPGTQFLGTTDSQPLELKVNGQRGLRLEYGESGFFQSVNVIGGFGGNYVGSGVIGATIGGGGSSFGDSTNRVLASFSTVSGGLDNTASGSDATVSGGSGNTASGSFASVSGGLGNIVSGVVAMVSGGEENTASGDFSFAAGRQAKANHQGAFVWADSTIADFASDRADQFKVRANGGVYLSGSGNSTAPQVHIAQTSSDFVRLRMTSGTQLFWDIAAGGGNNVLNFFNQAPSANLMSISTNGTVTALAFNPTSDRNQKENFSTVNPREVLDKVAGMPIASWNFKNDPRATHIGPMAQDFYAAFGTGADDKHIATVDADGVALAAIQGLNQKVEIQNQETKTRIQKLTADWQQRLQQKDTEIEVLIQELADLKRRLDAMPSRPTGPAL